MKTHPTVAHLYFDVEHSRKSGTKDWMRLIHSGEVLSTAMALGPFEGGLEDVLKSFQKVHEVSRSIVETVPSSIVRAIQRATYEAENDLARHGFLDGMEAQSKFAQKRIDDHIGTDLFRSILILKWALMKDPERAWHFGYSASDVWDLLDVALSAVCNAENSTTPEQDQHLLDLATYIPKCLFIPCSQMR